MFRKFRELGIARRVLALGETPDVKLQVLRESPISCRIEWQAPAYHTVLQILQHPIYAGAYVFGRKSQHIRVVDGRARKTMVIVTHGEPIRAPPTLRVAA